MSECVLATGGAGYIGSHVAVALMAAGYRVVLLDNFENSSPEAVDRIEEIVGCRVPLVEGDVRDRALVQRILQRHGVTSVIHLAGRKSVGESTDDPLRYFTENLNGAISLLTAMHDAGVPRLVFSSSATVYGNPDKLPVDETAPTRVTSPYGRTKLMIEEIIDDYVTCVGQMQAISLRYFNPVGAHSSGLIGEVPNGIPNNLFPYVVSAAMGERAALRVFGSDYPTPDGTGLRDYIHVEDLARGHVAALRALREGAVGLQPHQRINLGTGRGYSVLQVIEAFSQATGFPVPYELAPRRAGDVAASVADPTLAQTLLGWKARHDLQQMCESQWAFRTRSLVRSVAMLPPAARHAAALHSAMSSAAE